jgi:hypothetical protein
LFILLIVPLRIPPVSLKLSFMPYSTHAMSTFTAEEGKGERRRERENVLVTTW